MKMTPKRVSCVFLTLVFAFCLFRAARQSFTIDEAYTFVHFVDVDVDESLKFYSANNHVLQTILTRFFYWILGKNELVLRIPNLLGCVLYLTACYRICRAAFADHWWMLISLAVMTLNPLVLDLMVAARGYALALGLSWWALYLVWSTLGDGPRPRRLWLAGVCAGLALSANLIFVLPLGALGLLVLPLFVQRGRFWELIDNFAGPALVVSFVLLAIPLSHTTDQFYYGVKTMEETISSIVGQSIGQRGGGEAMCRWLEGTVPNFRRILEGYLVPICFYITALCGAVLWLRSFRMGDQRATLLSLVCGMLAISVAGWVAMHYVLGMVYPLNRTTMYVFPLFGFALVLGAALAPWSLVRIVAGSGGLALGLIYLSELRSSYFDEWRFDAGTNRLARALRQDASELHKRRDVVVGGSWIVEHTLRYYRLRYRMAWLRVLDANERKTETPDYYVLTEEDRKQVQELGLKVIEEDALSGTILARRG